MIDKEFVIDRYVNKNMSAREIAKELGLKSCADIHRCINNNGIKRRYNKVNKLLTKEYLEEHYVRLGKTPQQIAKELNIRSRTSVAVAIREFGIKKIIRKKPTSQRGRYGVGEMSGKQYCVIKIRAARYNYEFNITIEDIWNQFLKQDRKCALSGVLLTLAKDSKPKSFKEQTASLDRIDSTKGYTPENIQWVHKIVNKMKQNITDEEFTKWCCIIANNYNDKYFY